jgi:hypothetical protein
VTLIQVCIRHHNNVHASSHACLYTSWRIFKHEAVCRAGWLLREGFCCLQKDLRIWLALQETAAAAAPAGTSSNKQVCCHAGRSADLARPAGTTSSSSNTSNKQRHWQCHAVVPL